MSIDERAVVDSSAIIADGVTIGPFCVIGPDVEIGENTWIGPHVVINGPTRIGKENRIFQFSSIGEIPQDKKFHGELSKLEIGDRNTIREYATINRGTDDGGGVTRVGNDNWLMAYIHVAHDCIVGNDIIMANAASIAGHTVVDDHAIMGGFAVTHQFTTIGSYAFCGLGSVITRDIPPYVIVNGNPAEPHGINVEGLKRREFSKESIKAIRKAYKLLYRSGLPLEEAKQQITDLAADHQEVQVMVDFLNTMRRSIVR
ncbi:MAG: acyl-ACP--UDP-N-acetylglucosamine O-acyltransferase [Gammaproteobacteria bacterium]